MTRKEFNERMAQIDLNLRTLSMSWLLYLRKTISPLAGI